MNTILKHALVSCLVFSLTPQFSSAGEGYENSLDKIKSYLPFGKHYTQTHNKEQSPLNLSKSQLKTLTEAQLIRIGQFDLKVGDVRAHSRTKNIYDVKILNAENQVVMTFYINKDTGRFVRKINELSTAEVKKLVDAQLILQGKYHQQQVSNVARRGSIFEVTLSDSSGKTLRTFTYKPFQPLNK